MFVGGTVGTVSGGETEVQNVDEAPDPEEYEDILADMEGDGSAEDPYLITDIVELQALEAGKNSAAELANDIDASATTEWNPMDFSAGLFFFEQEEYQLGYSPVVEDSETVELVPWEGGESEELEPSEYTIDYETGVVELDIEHPEDDYLQVLYEPVEEVYQGFTPIARSPDPFTRVLDGAGHVIHNLMIDRREATSVALIDATGEGGEIRNLKLTDADVSASGQAAGIVGISAATTITNVSAHGSFEAIGSIGLASAIVADLRSGTITHCRGDGTIDGDSSIGGIAGIVIEGTVSNSYSTAQVTGTSRTGGLVGQLGIGPLEEGEEALLRDSYWDTEASGQSDATGIIEEGDGTAELQGEVHGLPTEEMQGESAAESMEEFDFDETWQIRPYGYPALPFEEVLTVTTYVDDETGEVETNGLRTALDDWRAGDIEINLLRDVIAAWRSDESVE